MLEPRRIAARSAARRIAVENGWILGGKVGYQIRFDVRKSQETKVLVVTEGILTRRLQKDPFLESVSVVILDEFHERSIHTDLALALLKDLAESARPDLKILVMSATLSTEPVSEFLGSCPTMDIPVKEHTVDIEYMNRRDERPITHRAADGVMRSLHENDRSMGDILVFLPGMGEIRKTEELLASNVMRKDLKILPLHGSLPTKSQDLAITPQKYRKIILSTNLAETSLTIDGVDTVVDTGYARIVRHDPRYGVDKLELKRISKASATQRAGRAGRTGPGRAYRLWTRSEQASLPDQEIPQIQRIDLASTILEILAWGTDPESFNWFEKPNLSGIDRAIKLLRNLNTVTDGKPKLTHLGWSLLKLPLHPRLGIILVEACRKGMRKEGALIASLLSERDILIPQKEQYLSHPSDILYRLELILNPQRASKFGPLIRKGVVANVNKGAKQFYALSQDIGASRKDKKPCDDDLLRILLSGYPDRVGKRRSEGGDEAVLVGGGGARFSSKSMVREDNFFVAISIDGGQKNAHSTGLIRMASRIDPEWLSSEFPDCISVEDRLEFDKSLEKVIGTRKQLYNDLVLFEKSISDFSTEDAANLLMKAAEENPGRAIEIEPEAEKYIRRVQSLSEWMPKLGLPDFCDKDLKEFLPVICAMKRSFKETRKTAILPLVKKIMGPEHLKALRKFAPKTILIPSGREATLEYEPGRAPKLAVRIQEMFGEMRTPTVAGGEVKVLLHLLGPNMRPVQITDDLENFWKNTYLKVRKDLRGRYPKHSWPEDPQDGKPLRKTPSKRKKK